MYLYLIYFFKPVPRLDENLEVKVELPLVSPVAESSPLDEPETIAFQEEEEMKTPTIFLPRR